MEPSIPSVHVTLDQPAVQMFVCVCNYAFCMCVCVCVCVSQGQSLPVDFVFEMLIFNIDSARIKYNLDSEMNSFGILSFHLISKNPVGDFCLNGSLKKTKDVVCFEFHDCKITTLRLHFLNQHSKLLTAAY